MSYLFFIQSIRKFRQVGSIIPSSSFLASSICEQIDFTSASVLVELGPGTGVMTRLILSKMTKQCHLLCIEQNSAFSEQLNREINDSQAQVIQGNAQGLHRHLHKHNVSGVDCIISSLPLFNMPTRAKARILHACQKSLKFGGCFLQYQYSISDKKFVQRYFANVRTRFVLLNIPPAFVYTCTQWPGSTCFFSGLSLLVSVSDFILPTLRSFSLQDWGRFSLIILRILDFFPFGPNRFSLLCKCSSAYQAVEVSSWCIDWRRHYLCYLYFRWKCLVGIYWSLPVSSQSLPFRERLHTSCRMSPCERNF